MTDLNALQLQRSIDELTAIANAQQREIDALKRSRELDTKIATELRRLSDIIHTEDDQDPTLRRVRGHARTDRGA